MKSSILLSPKIVGHKTPKNRTFDVVIKAVITLLATKNQVAHMIYYIQAEGRLMI